VELDEQMHNKFTSLKSLFKSTDPSKHFHGNKVKKFSTGEDQLDPSQAQLTSKSNSSNAPVSMGFKDKLLSHYRENFSQLHENTSTRIYHNALSAKSAEAGIKLHSKYTNPQILKNTRKFASKEKQITKSDSEMKADTALMTTINREHEHNYEMQHHQQHHPEPVEPRLKQHVLAKPSVLSKFMPKKSHVSSPAMHNPQLVARKQDSLAVHHAPTAPAVHIDTTPSHSMSHPTPVHPVVHPARLHKTK
jgi:hypothetical protein